MRLQCASLVFGGVKTDDEEATQRFSSPVKCSLKSNPNVDSLESKADVKEMPQSRTLRSQSIFNVYASNSK